jgi:hypothetical protein
LDNVVSLKDIKEEREKLLLDQKASLTVLETCLRFLEMSKIKETETIKKQIKVAMKELRRKSNVR